jgi:ATP-binding cassette subfamily B protein
MFNFPRTIPAFIWHFTKPHIGKLTFALLIILGVSLHLTIQPYLLKLIIDRVASVNENPALLLNDSYILWAVVGFIFLSILFTVQWRLIDYLFLKTFPDIKARVSSEAFHYISYHSHEYFQNHLSGDLVNKIRDISRGAEELFEPIFNVLRILLVVLFSVLVSFTIHFYFAFVLLLWVIIFTTTAWFLSKNIIKYVKDYAKARSRATGKLSDSVINSSNIRLFANEKFEDEYLESAWMKVAEKDKTLRWKLVIIWAIQGFLCSLVLAIMMVLLVILRAKDLVTPGDFAFIITISITIIQEVWALSEVISRVTEQVGVISQGLSLISIPHDIVDAPGAKDLRVVQGRIEVNNLNFSYSSSKPLFKNLNTVIQAKEKIGLVGYSGSGKTTFVNLLARVFEVEKGKIFIDGQDITTVTQQSLRKNISYISQDPILFHRSLIENIRYGRLDASDEEVIKAAQQAHAHEFILNTPKGYHSLVGERGIKLSGGQRQRIAIARAILKNAPILILDEATSSLDSLTEELIQESLKTIMEDRTVIVIAHRLSTLLFMDRILVFDQGRIIEEGSHRSLFQHKGLYTTLWESQVGGFLVE